MKAKSKQGWLVPQRVLCPVGLESGLRALFMGPYCENQLHQLFDVVYSFIQLCCFHSSLKKCSLMI